MIINNKVAMAAVKSGRAECHGHMTQDGRRYAIITRFDVKRTDHTPDSTGIFDDIADQTLARINGES